MEIKEEKDLRVDEQKDLIDNMRNEIEKLQDSLREQSEKLEAGKKNDAILRRLFEKGIIDNEGNLH